MNNNEELGKTSRDKSAPTKKRKVAQVQEGFWEAYPEIIKKITKPTKGEWINTLWKVSLILSVFGLLLFSVDWLLLKGILGFQSWESPLGITWLAVAYIIVILLTGLVAVLSVLAQEGTSQGITSALGSSVQYGDTTGIVVKRISKIAVYSSGLLLVEVLFAPVFLGGGLL